VLDRIASRAFPRQRPTGARPLGGLRNANFLLRLDAAPHAAVLRIYEHDPSLCRKELDLLTLVRGAVPVPETIYAEPSGLEEIPPFLVSEYIEGLEFRDLKRGGDARSVSQAAYDAGQVLACIGRTTFAKPGWLGPGAAPSHPLLAGANQVPRFAELCLASENLQRRMGPDLRERTAALLRSYAAQLAALEDERRLVHGDFSRRNLIVRQVEGKWAVAAVLDWEFAFSGSPLADIGHFLRSERVARPLIEPSFSNGYVDAGGRLPDGWRRLARVLDAIALCESLTHDELPAEAARELVELVSATVDDRDPRLP